MSKGLAFLDYAVIAVFFATMSSLAGNFNAAAAVITDALKMKSMLAARVATIIVGGLVVALTFVMQYAQGADDLFNLSNKVFGVFLPPIAIPMLCGIFVRKFSKRSGLMGLVGGIAVGLAIFIVGAKPELAYLREMIWIFPMTAAATMVFLVLGTVFFPDKSEEREAVESFFRQINAKA